MNKVAKLIVNFVLIVIIVVGVAVGNSIAFRYEGEINTLLAPPIVDEEAVQLSSSAGQEMSARIMEEGAVLLQNKDNTLPLDYNTVKKVNVFGWRSVDWIYGSEGQNASGGVAPEDDDFEKNVDIYKALNKYGIEYNQQLFDMYNRYVKPDHQSANLKAVHISTLISLREPKITDRAYYTDDLLTYTENFSDTAIVVIGRMAGEGMNANTTTQQKEGAGVTDDNTRHYLEISTEEEALLRYCGETFENVIVLLNVANAFECGFLETIPGIDSCLYIGFTGTRAASAIPKLLYGEVSPSGRTVDTFAYDLFTNPANVFLGGLNYTDYNRSYSDNVENIYIGYKWYETADTEGVWADVKNDFGTGYEGVVQFPFGYGESYNTYSWNVDEISVEPGSSIDDNTKITFTVSVTNNGEYPGRDVVEIYYTAPYTKGGIEKSSVVLAAFNKTNIIDPGATQQVTIEVDADDFASYDCYDRNKNDNCGYELEAGEYSIKLQTDSHTVKEVTYGGETMPGEFKYNVDETILIKTDKVTGKEVGNLFTGDDAIDITPIDANDGDFVADIPWFTRENFMKPEDFAANYKPRAATPSTKVDDRATAERLLAWDNATTDAFGNPVDTTPVTWGASGNLKIAENGVITDLGKKLGADYDAPEWEQLLNQITIAEATDIINNYYGSDAINSVGKPYLADFDGPSQIKGFNYAPRGTGFPTMVVIAATWNPNLAYEFGKAYGDDMKALGVFGVWGWAIDTHRTAFFGRNHESPSEDATLAAVIVTNAVKGLNTRGRYCFLKHFALYGYGGDNIWTTEQALRENYLRPFHDAVVDGGALGMMTTYQGVGAEHSETTEALLSGVLRGEWDFKGAITTDYIGTNAYCDSLLRCGGNFGMGVALGKVSDVTYSESSPVRLQHRMRDAMHQILYMYLRADYNEQQYLANPDSDNETFISSNSITSWIWWKPMLYTIDAVVGIGCALWVILLLISVGMHTPPKKKAENAAAVERDGEGGGEQ